MKCFFFFVCGQYSVGILRIIKESLAQNGLRHNDYQRYRQYCSRRLHRLRRSLNFKHGCATFTSRTVRRSAF